MLYRVTTDVAAKHPVTEVFDAAGARVAALEWREVLPDKVTLAGGKGPMSLREWLKTSLVPFFLKE